MWEIRKNRYNMAASTIYHLFKKNVEHTPDKIAILCNEKSITYSELLMMTDTLVFSLKNIGVTFQTHIALSLHNSELYAPIFLAISQLGAVAVPLPPSLKIQQLETALSKTRCKFFIGSSVIIQEILIHNILPANFLISTDKELKDIVFFDTMLIAPNDKLNNSTHIDINEPYILTMTSGSTGDPKPIIFSQQTKITRALEATIEPYNLTKDDVILVCTPLYHSLAQRSLIMPLILGAQVVILSHFTPSIWATTIQKHHISFTFAVSSQLEIILNELNDSSYNFSSLKTIISSSAPLKNETKLKLLKYFNCDIREIYGASEIGVATDISIRYETQKYGSVGKPLPFVDLKIIDDKQNILFTNEVGEIACKTLTCFKGYYENPHATQSAFTENNYFCTGDLGKIDEDGYLYYIGRKKELIITGGINVFPRDVEEILLGVKGVKEAAVIGINDDYFGEAILAIVVAESDVTIKHLQRACVKHLANHQQPLAYEFVSSLPKNDLGKLKKYELKALYANYPIKKIRRNL